MKTLELKVPPLVTLLAAALLAWAAARYTSTPLDFDLSIKRPVLGVIIAFGVALAAYAVAMFRRQDTTVNPVAPEKAEALVTTGVYRYTRNPMYVGMLIVLSGWVIYLGSAIGSLGILVFVIYMTRFQIQPEERILKEKFGQAYSDYCGKVRRWL